jgi:Ca-activated chloride channel family protein
MDWWNARRLLLGAAVSAVLPFVAHARQDGQTFKSAAELVVLHVNVFDKRSDAVPELPQSAFTIFEDDRPQDIAFFSAGDVPVTVGLVIDNSTSMLTEREMVVSGANAFAESSHPEDQMFAIVFNEYIRKGLPDTIDFTKNRAQLRASLVRFPPGGKTALYDAVIAGLDHLERAGYQKRVLVVLSDGGDNASRHTEQEMLDRISSSSALVYTVLDPNVAVPGESRPSVLRRMAGLSGGVSYFPKNSRDLLADFQEIAANIRRGYSIGYSPSSAQHRHDQKHRVKVMVRVPGRSDLSVRVRNGYTEPVTPGTR